MNLSTVLTLYWESVKLFLNLMHIDDDRAEKIQLRKLVLKAYTRTVRRSILADKAMFKEESL